MNWKLLGNCYSAHAQALEKNIRGKQEITAKGELHSKNCEAAKTRQLELLLTTSGWSLSQLERIELEWWIEGVIAMTGSAGDGFNHRDWLAGEFHKCKCFKIPPFCLPALEIHESLCYIAERNCSGLGRAIAGASYDGCFRPSLLLCQEEIHFNAKIEKQRLGTGGLWYSLCRKTPAMDDLVAIKKDQTEEILTSRDLVMNEIKLVSSVSNPNRTWHGRKSSHISNAPQGTPGYLDPRVPINISIFLIKDWEEGCVDEIVDPYLDPNRDAWTLSSIHERGCNLRLDALLFHRDMRPFYDGKLQKKLEQIMLSAWTPPCSWHRRHLPLNFSDPWKSEITGWFSCR
ncbi:hypothetical protein NC652_012444 [Populus alba x Populus x berolinensis]|nr:hypothetical protein NC652_012444 [Populus alba x Populus x berolinensis]